MKPQVDPAQYLAHEYDSKERFCSYWHQLNEIITLNPASVLEIGVGNGFLSRYLKRRGFNLHTLDLDTRLNPDVVGTVSSLPFRDNSFEAVVCYEVLEHLPFDQFLESAFELNRVTRAHAIISLPDASSFIRIVTPPPMMTHFALQIPIPTLRKRPHVFDGEHFWEIGKAGYPLKRILDGLAQAGFTVLKTYRMRENPYHRFLVLRKRIES